MVGVLFRKGYNVFSRFYYNRIMRFYKKGPAGATEVLLGILNDAKHTEYGRRFHFDRVHDAQSYAREVPLATYADFAPYIEKQQAGIQGVLTQDHPVYFAKSSGTTGAQKIIPMTAKSLRGVNMTMMLLHQGALQRLIPAPRFPGRGLMMLNMAGMDADQQSGAATSGGMAKMKGVVPLFWVTPSEALSIPDEHALTYLHALFALNEENLGDISAPFASSVLRLFKTMEQHWNALVDDIATGTINAGIVPDAAMRETLQAYLPPNPTRAMALHRIGKRGMAHVAPHLWPTLSCINTAISGDFAAYEAPLRYYLGSDVPIYSSMYGASEGQIGIGVRLNEPVYLLCTHLTYFEFIPEAAMFDANPPVYDLTEVQPGERYELVITTSSGFYRYRLGDVVQVADFYHGVPLVTYCYRIGMLQNLTGEKTSTDAIMHALNETSQELGVHLSDFTTVSNISDDLPVYEFLVETPHALPTQFAHVLDVHLGKANPRYLAAREAGKLAPCLVTAVPAACFQAFRNHRVASGTSTNQFKMPRRLSPEEAAPFFTRSEEMK